MRKAVSAFSSLLLVTSLLLGACAPAAPLATPAPTPGAAVPALGTTLAPTPAGVVTPLAAASAAAPAVEKPRYGGMLLTNQRGDAPSYDGHQERTFHTQNPLSSAYSLLVQNDPLNENKIIPDLAENWEASPDGKVWTFNLHKGVRFHDGRPATSADVKVSFDRIAQPPKGILSPRSGLFTALERVETSDEYTVKFYLKYPQASFLTMVAIPYNWVFPKHILDRKGDMTKDVMGTGPFKLKEYVRGVSWEMVRNPDYFVPSRPYLDGITRYIIADRAAQMAAIRTHRIHLSSQQNNEFTPGEREILKREVPGVVIQRRGRPGPHWFFFNLKREPWSDVRVRRAVHLAFDRPASIAVAARGDAEVTSYLIPGSGWEIPSGELLKMPGFRQPKDQDIAEAKRLLAEAGYPNGFKFSMITRNEALYVDKAIFMKGELAKIGIDATLEPRETGAYYTRVFAHDFSAGSQSMGFSTSEPDEILSTLYLKDSGSNYMQYYNPKVDELFIRQSQTMDAGERKKLLRQIENILLEDLPLVLYHNSIGQGVFWPEVRNWVQPGSIYLNQKFQDVWLAP